MSQELWEVTIFLIGKFKYMEVKFKVTEELIEEVVMFAQLSSGTLPQSTEDSAKKINFHFL